jgi:hypothetical protein
MDSTSISQLTTYNYHKGTHSYHDSIMPYSIKEEEVLRNL